MKTMLVWMESQTTRAIGQVLTLLHTISTTSATTTSATTTAGPPYALSPALTALLAQYTASTLTTTTTPTKPVTGTGTGIAKKEDPLKEAEDSILNNLKTLGKILRGAAELLTDPTTDTNTSTSTTTTSSTNMDVDGDANSTHDNTNSTGNSTYLRTARESLQKLLTPETRKYASEIRLIVLEFLIFIHERLSTLSPTVTATATTTTTIGTTSTSSEVESVYASLGNNALVRGAWVKLLSICITRRQACKNTYVSILIKHTSLLTLLYIYLCIYTLYYQIYTHLYIYIHAHVFTY